MASQQARPISGFSANRNILSLAGKPRAVVQAIRVTYCLRLSVGDYPDFAYPLPATTFMHHARKGSHLMRCLAEKAIARLGSRWQRVKSGPLHVGQVLGLADPEAKPGSD